MALACGPGGTCHREAATPPWRSRERKPPGPPCSAFDSDFPVLTPLARPVEEVRFTTRPYTPPEERITSPEPREGLEIVSGIVRAVRERPVHPRREGPLRTRGGRDVVATCRLAVWAWMLTTRGFAGSVPLPSNHILSILSIHVEKHILLPRAVFSDRMNRMNRMAPHPSPEPREGLGIVPTHRTGRSRTARTSSRGGVRRGRGRRKSRARHHLARPGVRISRG